MAEHRALRCVSLMFQIAALEETTFLRYTVHKPLTPTSIWSCTFICILLRLKTILEVTFISSYLADALQIYVFEFLY